MIIEDTREILNDLKQLKKPNRQAKKRRPRFFRSIVSIQGVIGITLDSQWDDLPDLQSLLLAETSHGRHYPLPTEG